MYSLFLTWSAASGRADGTAERAAPSDLERLGAFVAATPDLADALVYTPVEASLDHPYAADGSGPPLVVELRFDRIEAMEAAAAPAGHLHGLADPALLPGLAGAGIAQQAMLRRRFPVDDPTPAADGPPCSYLVHYPGPAEDTNAWLAHYLAHHPAIMREFPGIRSIEICTRIDWTGLLPFRREHHMQRNTVRFDGPAALAAALASPVMPRMRADFAQLPPFSGGNCHYPMTTRTIVPRG